MWRHVTMVLAAVAMAAFFVPGEASARGGHWGGFHGGFHGGGFHHHHGFGFAPGFAIGFGVGAPYGYYGYPPYGVYDSGYDGGCYLVRRRVWTDYGWRRRTVQVCD